MTASWILAAGAAGAHECSHDALAHAAAQMLAEQRDLQAIEIGDGFETTVSTNARRAIARMKDKIDAYVATAMRCEKPDATEQDVRRVLTGLGGLKSPVASAVAKPAANSPPRYGDGLVFLARAAPGIVSVVARFGIECGADAMLMIFEQRGDGWDEVLRSQSAPYGTVAGGWWSFDYAISPRDGAGQWFVVTKSIAPWCSSTWSAIRYAVLRPRARPAEPRRIFARSDSIWWGNDNFGDLKVGAQDFDLRFRAESIDDGVHNREWIRHYSVIEDTVRRIAPLAESPRDFADEWIASSWADAASWTSTAARPRLERLHERLHRLRFLDYVSEHGCPGGRYQIEVEPSDPGDGATNYYFLVDGRADFAMFDVARAADPACNKPDLIDPPIPK
jgi:hypothetical protein